MKTILKGLTIALIGVAGCVSLASAEEVEVTTQYSDLSVVVPQQVRMNAAQELAATHGGAPQVRCRHEVEAALAA